MVCDKNRLHFSSPPNWMALCLAFCSLPASGFQEIDRTVNFDFPGYGRSGFIRSPGNNDRKLGTSPQNVFQIDLQPVLGASLNLSMRPPLSLNKSGAERENRDRIESHINAYLLRNLSARLSLFDSGEMIVGTQILNTPHLHSVNQNRITKLFQGLTASYNLTEGLQLAAYYVNENSDSGNLADSEFFASPQPRHEDRRGDASIAAALFDIGGLNAEAWYYRTDDVDNIFYMQLKHRGAFNQSMSYKMGVQFDWAQNTAIDGSRDVDSQNLGVIGSVNWQDLMVFAAHNHELGDTPPAAAWGDGPYFTSMYGQTSEAIGDKTARSTSGGFLYTPSLEYLQGLEFGVSGGWFRTADRETYDLIETDYSLNYGFSETGSVELAYAYISDKISTEDYSQLRIILSYVF